jgi:molybdenum cofactor biosynthesis enzyme MoaA
MFDKKILCLGNNGDNTDTATLQLATNSHTINHGLILSPDFVATVPGYYHTTVMDIPAGGILQLAKQFDQVIMLDQPYDEWTHWKILLSTYKIMLEIDKLGISTVYKDNKNIERYRVFYKMLDENKSFCIYPWINFVSQDSGQNLCARSPQKITTLTDLKNWKSDPTYQEIRNKMLRGEKLLEACSVCYDYENKNIESYRIFETKEWITKLNINSIEDLNNISKPYYYELRLSNKCNLMCRSCRPVHSHLIDKEYKKFNIIFPDNQKIDYSNLSCINIPDLDKDTRVYLTGGEPTIMHEVIKFMQECVDQGRTDFDFTLGTNAQKLSPKFLELSQQFSNMNFSISLDGYGKVNDYWRWGSDWDTVIKNTHVLKNQGHTISINTVPGIYNVTNLHLLFEFLDQEFPHISLYLQINTLDFQSAYNHPDPKLVVESMKRCQQTQVYHSDGKSNRTTIDSLHDYYLTNPKCNIEHLRKFFEFNDRLDQVRNVKLKDYIPELEDGRRYIV